MIKKSNIYVHLLEEGTPTLRPVSASKIGDNSYIIHATDDYDPEDEIWEFLPESTVLCETEVWQGEKILVAKSLAD